MSPVFRALTPKNQKIELYLHIEASNVAQERPENSKASALSGRAVKTLLSPFTFPFGR